MSENINKKAYEQAEKELLESKVEKVKGYILHTLKKIEEKKMQKERIEEELRILRLDLDDLRNGRFEKIEERIEKSKIARQVSVPNLETLAMNLISDCTRLNSSFTSGMPNWTTLTSGTYNTGTKIIYF